MVVTATRGPATVRLALGDHVLIRIDFQPRMEFATPRRPRSRAAPGGGGRERRGIGRRDMYFPMLAVNRTR